MFPALTIVMENAVKLDNMPEHFFVNLFSVMYMGMAPLTSGAAIIAEEKEKNTLRVLQMCNVKSFEYLIGNAIYVIFICMIGSLIMGLTAGYKGTELVTFMGIMLVGHICSFLLGAAIGVASKNQMTATSLTVPVMMVLAFLPMLSMFNDTIKRIAKFFFSEQLYQMINNRKDLQITWENGLIMACNMVLIAVLFLVVYRKNLTHAN